MTSRPGALGRNWLVVLVSAMVVLSLLAWLSPSPDRITDRDVYERIARTIVVPGCAELHCFRPLVAATLGALPGPSLLKWKAYAAVMNAAAAAAVFALCLGWGLSSRAAWMAAFMSALGFGSLYTLHDVFTSDPLMYALGPLLTIALMRERVALAGTLAAVGVTAKEFAVAPLYVFACATWLGGRRALAWRAATAANWGFLIWLSLQLFLMIGFNYGYGNSPSTHLLSGGYLRAWLQNLSPSAAFVALAGEFGVMWLLMVAGWWLAPVGLRHLAASALPVAAIFAYVQQPDRALWNFHFLAAPLSALVLERVPQVLAWATLLTFAAANLRLGAQLPGIPGARFTLVLSMMLGVIAIIAARPHLGADAPTPGVATVS